ncbi:ABC transporter substrate-binding protein [Paenibacillus sp. 481]|uniref:ABC transporter substrate-binding protein n=1 Tax=Paenibacillus sp. 481 TaxID=2835869 RepID=UPI001E2BE012|nr:extracellular solute-binding protein [Paenibacillus sp. 481]UHA74939.1 extracellular solute-binding protein [Paenibacillus sp. 481]
MKGRKLKLLVVLMTTMSLLAGCMGEKPVLEELDGGKGTIKILSDNEQWFYSQYGNTFKLKHPNIDFEIISTKHHQRPDMTQDEREKLEKKLITEKKPDVLFLNQKIFSEFIQDGKLYNLEPVIKQEQFDLQGYMPGFIDMLREMGSGSIYGLTPEINTQVIYYNADLFKKQGIDLPQNKMTWSDLLALSARFNSSGTNSKDKIVGFSEEGYRGKAELLFKMAATAGLTPLDSKGETIQIQTESWKKVMTTATEAFRNNSVYTAPDEKNIDMLMERGNKFAEGKAAMMMSYPYYARSIDDMKYYDKKAKEFEWGMVTAPIDPAAPDESAFTNLDTILAISKDATNKRAAWEFVKFVNGIEMAQATSRSSFGSLPTRNQFYKEISGKSTDVFYALKPKANGQNSWYSSVPWKFSQKFFDIINEHMQAVIDKKKTVDQALAEIQQKAQAELKLARDQEKADKKDTK